MFVVVVYVSGLRTVMFTVYGLRISLPFTNTKRTVCTYVVHTTLCRVRSVAILQAMMMMAYSVYLTTILRQIALRLRVRYGHTGTVTTSDCDR